MAAMSQQGLIGLDNQPLAMTATRSQAVLHITPDTTGWRTDAHDEGAYGGCEVGAVVRAVLPDSR
jgi:hypothetical protein